MVFPASSFIPFLGKLISHAPSQLTKHPLIFLTLPIHQINRPQHIAFIRLTNVSIHHHLIQKKVYLLQLVHDIELTYRPSPPVHRLHERVYEFEQSQLILVILRALSIATLLCDTCGGFPDVDVRLRPDDEEEAGVPPVYDLEAAVLKEGALQLAAREALADDLRFERDSLLHVHPLIVGREAGL